MQFIFTDVLTQTIDGSLNSWRLSQLSQQPRHEGGEVSRLPEQLPGDLHLGVRHVQTLHEAQLSETFPDYLLKNIPWPSTRIRSGQSYLNALYPVLHVSLQEAGLQSDQRVEEAQQV